MNYRLFFIVLFIVISFFSKELFFFDQEFVVVLSLILFFIFYYIKHLRNNLVIISIFVFYFILFLFIKSYNYKNFESFRYTRNYSVEQKFINKCSHLFINFYIKDSINNNIRIDLMEINLSYFFFFWRLYCLFKKFLIEEGLLNKEIQLYFETYFNPFLILRSYQVNSPVLIKSSIDDLYEKKDTIYVNIYDDLLGEQIFVENFLRFFSFLIFLIHKFLYPNFYDKFFRGLWMFPGMFMFIKPVDLRLPWMLVHYNLIEFVDNLFYYKQSKFNLLDTKEVFDFSRSIIITDNKFIERLNICFNNDKNIQSIKILVKYFNNNVINLSKFFSKKQFLIPRSSFNSLRLFSYNFSALIGYSESVGTKDHIYFQLFFHYFLFKALVVNRDLKIDDLKVIRLFFIYSFFDYHNFYFTFNDSLQKYELNEDYGNVPDNIFIEPLVEDRPNFDFEEALDDCENLAYLGLLNKDSKFKNYKNFKYLFFFEFEDLNFIKKPIKFIETFERGVFLDDFHNFHYITFINEFLEKVSLFFFNESLIDSNKFSYLDNSYSEYNYDSGSLVAKLTWNINKELTNYMSNFFYSFLLDSFSSIVKDDFFSFLSSFYSFDNDFLISLDNNWEEILEINIYKLKRLEYLYENSLDSYLNSNNLKEIFDFYDKKDQVRDVNVILNIIKNYYGR